MISEWDDYEFTKGRHVIMQRPSALMVDSNAAHYQHVSVR